MLFVPDWGYFFLVALRFEVAEHEFEALWEYEFDFLYSSWDFWEKVVTSALLLTLSLKWSSTQVKFVFGLYML